MRAKGNISATFYTMLVLFPVVNGEPEVKLSNCPIKL